ASRTPKIASRRWRRASTSTSRSRSSRVSSCARWPGCPAAEAVFASDTLTHPESADTIPAMARYQTRTRPFPRAEDDRLLSFGVFQPDEEIELIGGQVHVV